MAVKPVVKGVYQISLGFVNAFLLEGDGLTLIDTGVSASPKAILAAIDELGRKPEDVRHILLTHLHGDHTGGLAVLKRKTGASAMMHPLDAADVRRGISMRPSHAGPGWLNHIIHRLMPAPSNSSSAKKTGIEPAEIESEITGGQVLGFASDLRVIHLPGHTAGHLAFLWTGGGGLLILGDAASHMTKLGYSILYEDFEENRRSLQSLAEQPFEHAAFSHGKPILGGAREQLLSLSA